MYLTVSNFLNHKIPIIMDIDKLEHLQTFRKANRCATLYELLCEALGLEALSPSTTWRDIAKSYSLTMEAAYNLENPNKDETTTD